MFEHQQKVLPGFTAKYGVTRLVWFEAHDTRDMARLRENRIKRWKRTWKLRLIESENPEWDDLAARLNDLLVF